MVNLICDLDVFTCKWFVSFDFDGGPHRSFMLQNMKMRRLYLDILSFECLYFCIEAEQHWERNRFECVPSVQCLKKKWIRWKIKGLTNNNNNNNNMTKLFIINWSSVDGCRCHHFEIIAFVFFYFFFFIFYSPHGDMESKMNAITTTLNRIANMNFNVNRILNCGTRFSLFILFEHRALGIVQFISCVHHLMLPIN